MCVCDQVVLFVFIGGCTSMNQVVQTRQKSGFEHFETAFWLGSFENKAPHWLVIEEAIHT